MSQLITSNPLVTVYIPTYNRVELLKRAVNSVLNQTFENLEVIVVDDCSTDGTDIYLKNIAAEESRIRYFLKKENSGPCVSRNIAIDEAKGLFITGLDDDDYFEKSRIESFLRAANKNENQAYCTSTKVKVSKEVVISPSVLNRLRFSKIKNYKKLLKQNYIGNQIFIKTEIIKKAGGFDENLKAWQDLECWFNLFKTQDIIVNFIKEPTQVIDLSHDHERITKKNVRNVVMAYKYIANKHKLNYYERKILEGQLIQYDPERFSTTHKIFLFIITQQAFYLKLIKGDI